MAGRTGALHRPGPAVETRAANHSRDGRTAAKEALKPAEPPAMDNLLEDSPCSAVCPMRAGHGRVQEC